MVRVKDLIDKDINFIQKLLTVNKYSRPGKKIESVEAIVIHWVENQYISAMGCRNYFESLPNLRRFAGCHFIVGKNGEVVQAIPTDEIAYHVGAKAYKNGIRSKYGYPNAKMLGIEFCHDSDGSPNKATYESLTRLTGLLMSIYNLDEDQIYRHYDITGKGCPRYYIKNEDAWNKFKQDAGSHVFL